MKQTKEIYPSGLGLNKLTEFEKRSAGELYETRRTCMACRELRWLGEFSLTNRGSAKDLNQETCNYCLKEPGRYWIRQEDPKWMESSACKGVEVEAFFEEAMPIGRPRNNPVEPRYKALCAACPVRQQCEDFAHQSQSVGVWGGIVMTARYHSGRGGARHEFKNPGPRVGLTGEERALVVKEMVYLYEQQGLNIHEIAVAMKRNSRTVTKLLTEGGAVVKQSGGTRGKH